MAQSYTKASHATLQASFFGCIVLNRLFGQRM
jgi:hypothetical protein